MDTFPKTHPGPFWETRRSAKRDPLAAAIVMVSVATFILYSNYVCRWRTDHLTYLRRVRSLVI